MPHCYLIEACCDVTLFAIAPEIAFVNIVLPMAGDAIGLQLCRIACFCMASRADQALVLPRKREARRNIVIELPYLPAIDGMTACAA